MKTNISSGYCLLLITLIHLGVIAFALMQPNDAVKKEIIKPSIQGILVVAALEPKKQITPEPPKPRPQQKRKKHKHKHKPLPKAPASEPALTEAPAPIEEPEATNEKPANPTPEAIIPPSTDADEVKNPAPAYPAMSKKLKEEGIVLLKILVTKDGRVTDIEIKNSSGFKRLDDAAVKAIKRWRFNPATQAGKAIDYWYEIDFDFSVKKK